MNNEKDSAPASLTARLDDHVAPALHRRLAGFNLVGDWIGRQLEHLRFILVLAFALICLLVGVLVSSDAAQAIATGTGAVLAGWAVLQLVRSDDAGFQTVEQQKRFLIAYATCLTGMRAQLAPVADTRIEYASFQSTFAPYLERLSRFDDGEIAILMALSAHPTGKAPDSDQVADLFPAFLDMRVILGALMSGDSELIKVTCARFQSASAPTVTVQTPTELQGVLFDRVRQSLQALRTIDTERLRSVYAQMRRTTKFLELVDDSRAPGSPLHLRSLSELAADAGQIFGGNQHPLIEWYINRLCNARTPEAEDKHEGSWMDESHVLWLYQTHADAFVALGNEKARRIAQEDLQSVAERSCFRDVYRKDEIVLSDDALTCLPAMVLLSMFDSDHLDAVAMMAEKKRPLDFYPIRPNVTYEDMPFEPIDGWEEEVTIETYQDMIRVDKRLSEVAETVLDARKQVGTGTHDWMEIRDLVRAERPASA